MSKPPASTGDAAGAPARRVHRAILLGAAAVLFAAIGGAFVLGAADVSVPRPIGFRFLMGVIIVCNVMWWAAADRQLAIWSRGGRVRASLRVGLAFAMVGLLLPVGRMLAWGHIGNLSWAPVWYVSGFQLWHMVLVVLVPPVTAAALLVAAIVSVLRAWRGRLRTTMKAGPPDSAADGRGLSRRQVLASAAVFAPAAVLGAVTLRYGRQTGRFLVNRYDVPAPWLPDRLRGLTITHISDLHLGRLYRPYMLPRLVDEANRLDGDLVVVTGDIVDVSNEMLPAAMDALRQLRHRHGMFLCIGNHDLIDNGDEFVRTLRRERFELLTDERRRVEIGGERLTVAGLDWTRRDVSDGRRPSHADHVREMLHGYRAAEEGPCIALAHHPHAFDALSAAGVPLTLSGHTHGGQLMLVAPRADGNGHAAHDRGAGAMLFRYVRGFYHRGPATLFVNSGVGNWFPVRINAPAEIVRLRLV